MTDSRSIDFDELSLEEKIAVSSIRTGVAGWFTYALIAASPASVGILAVAAASGVITLVSTADTALYCKDYYKKRQQEKFDDESDEDTNEATPNVNKPIKFKKPELGLFRKRNLQTPSTSSTANTASTSNSNTNTLRP